jgi:hypothetical protein
MKDPVSSQLRAVEREIDGFSKTNPLLCLPFAQATLQFMAFYEDLAVMQFLKEQSLPR